MPNAVLLEKSSCVESRLLTQETSRPLEKDWAEIDLSYNDRVGVKKNTPKEIALLLTVLRRNPQNVQILIELGSIRQGTLERFKRMFGKNLDDVKFRMERLFAENNEKKRSVKELLTFKDLEARVCIEAGIIEVVNYDRKMIIVEINGSSGQKYNQAFYKSTGFNSNKTDEWLPFDGIGIADYYEGVQKGVADFESWIDKSDYYSGTISEKNMTGLEQKFGKITDPALFGRVDVGSLNRFGHPIIKSISERLTKIDLENIKLFLDPTTKCSEKDANNFLRKNGIDVDSRPNSFSKILHKLSKFPDRSVQNIQMKEIIRKSGKLDPNFKPLEFPIYI